MASVNVNVYVYVHVIHIYINSAPPFPPVPMLAGLCASRCAPRSPNVLSSGNIVTGGRGGPSDSMHIFFYTGALQAGKSDMAGHTMQEKREETA